MGAPKPKATKAPFEQRSDQTTTSNQIGTNESENRFAPVSIADTPEAQAYLNYDVGIDPGVGRRADLAEQELSNQYNSAFAQGIPEFIRMRQQDAGLRGIRSDAAAERQQAEFLKKQFELGRLERLLPQILQTGQTQRGQTTGGQTQTGTSSGFNTQVMPGQPGAFSQFLGGLGQGLGGALPFI